MITLGIETSCDETSCAILENGNKIRANIISSSLAKHKPFGGVVPEIASRHSLENIQTVYEEALREAKIKQTDIDLVAVTKGPGLVGSLLVGVSYAKALAFALGKPLIGVHHLEAHLASNFILREKPKKPFIGLVVSGGHTSILYVKNFKYTELGSTADDAIGEAYDKSAKILGLGFPGGPVIDRLAQKGNPHAFRFTKPKVDGKFNFSFSGIKTAVLHMVEGVGAPPPFPSPLRGEGRVGVKWKGKKLHDLCASFQFHVTSWVIEKTLLAAEEKKVKTIVMGGGVSANSRLRNELERECKLRGFDLYIPPFQLTLDNAAMIARMGYERYKMGNRSDLRLAANASLLFSD